MGELKQQTQLEEHGARQWQAKISVRHIALSRKRYINRASIWT